MYEEYKEEVVAVLKYIEEKGWNYGRSGNISVLIRGNKHVLVTPSGVLKSKLRPGDILVVDMEGRVIEGRGRPTIELPLHLAIYRSSDHVNAVIHAHGIYSTTLAISREPLPPLIEEMIIRIGGGVEIAEYAPAGSRELAENVVRALGYRKAVIIANHGVVACGEDLEEAVEILGLVERISYSYILSKLIGKIYQLPLDIVESYEKTYLSRLKERKTIHRE